MEEIKMPITFDMGTIYDVCEIACEKATSKNAMVTFEFNEIRVRALPGSNPDDIQHIYFLCCELRRIKNERAN